MQALGDVTTDNLLAAGQVPLMKFEIEVGTDNWINLSALDGKNYVEDISISLGGASMTPKPIGGTLSVTLSNENSIFHPAHPTSEYKDYLKTGRKIRASIGAKYDSTPYYWQRLIGYMDEPVFDSLGQKVVISCADYMKLLQDYEFRCPDNYWGTYAEFSSIASDGLVGSELYNEVDAMDINNEDPNVDDWATTDCSFASEADDGGGSVYVGKMISSDSDGYIKNTNVGTAVAGKEYRLTLKYKRITTYGKLKISVLQDDGGEVEITSIDYLISPTYETVSFSFNAIVNGAIIIKAWIWDVVPGEKQFRIDQISIKEFIPYWDRYYELPGTSKGPYYVTLDGNPVWQGEEDEGWFHEESTRRVFFDINKVVANGTDNIVIYYFTTESPENAVADILVKCGLYADRATALSGMEYTPTEILIDKIWFDAGGDGVKAIMKLCERCDYRFHFKWDGTPVFKPKPAPESTAFTFTDQKHIASFSNYQDRREVKNRIVIEGMKQAEPVTKEETVPPELRGEKSDPTSIDTYGERTLSIRNHLFQDQDSILNEAGDAGMCVTLLAEYKDPKWYSNVEVPFNPVPLELGDKISWKERLSHVLEVTQTGVTRDIKIDNFNAIYKCENN